MKRLKRIMALVITIAMVLGMMSMTAFAGTPNTYEQVPTDGQYNSTYQYYRYQEGEYVAAEVSESAFQETVTSGNPLFIKYDENGEIELKETTDPTGDPDPQEPAADNTVGSIQLTNEPASFKDSHKYQVYQIFTGTLSEGVLSNVKYGANYGSTGSSVPKTELDLVTDARAFAEDLMNNGKLSGNPVAVLTADNFKAENLAPGYYLIVDTVEEASTSPADLADGDVFSQYIVQVLGAVTLETKKDVTEGDKTITADDHPDTEDSEQNPGISEDGKVDNVSIGDTVTFTITAKVPSHAADYDYYYFIINDTLSPGLTIDLSTLSVTSDDADKATLVANTASTTGDYELYVADAIDTEDAYKTPSGTNTFEVALIDAKSFAGKTITVTYKATLNENAVIGGNGNPNTQNVIYSNNPNEDYDGSQDNNNPGKPKSDSTVPVGTTPDSTTQTFTSGIKLQKLDQDGLALNGASFKIEGNSINKVVTNAEAFEVASDGEYWKLKTGAYTTEPPVTADKMQQLDNAQQGDDGYVLAEADYTGDDAITIDGVTYRVVDADGTPTHILIKKNDMLYVNTTTKYKKTTTESVQETAEHISQDLAVNADGTLNLEGLGAGTYTITETVVPQGYSAAAPATVVITFDNETKTFTATVNGTDVSADATTNLFPMDVINIAGHTLPSTGGIGTTIFYVVGAILVLGAGVVLITRRRMDA